MDGLKLAHAAHTRWPHIKIILVSGQIAVTDADKPDDSKFFPKPLEIQQMIAGTSGDGRQGHAEGHALAGRRRRFADQGK